MSLAWVIKTLYLYVVLFFIAGLGLAKLAFASCDNPTPSSNSTVTCTGSNGAVLAQPGSTNVTVNLTTGSTTTFVRNTPNTAVIQVDTSSTVTNAGSINLLGTTATGRGAAMLGANNFNRLVNNGVITTSGANNDGMALNGNNGQLVNNGTISVSGPTAYGMTAAWGQASGAGNNNMLVNTGAVNAMTRAISVVGGQSTVQNSGLLKTTGATTSSINTYTVLMQGNNINLTNSGSVIAQGANAQAIFSNTLGTSFTASIINEAGGEIISRLGIAVRSLNGITSIINAGLIESGTGTAINMGAGSRSNTLTLQTGSKIIGIADGGNSAVSVLTLQGSGAVENAFVNFGTLMMQGLGWTWSGSGVFNSTQVQSGKLYLSGTLGGGASVEVGAELAGTGILTGNLLNKGIVHPGAGDSTGGVTINGSYIGQNGTLTIDAILGGDTTPAGKLIVGGGMVSGNTSINVRNLAGVGGLTSADGIMLIQAVNGATSTPSAFMLGGGVSSGAYTYYLYKGGVSAGSQNNWYLRSSVPAPTVVTIVPDPSSGTTTPVTETLIPLAAPGTPPTPYVAIGADPVPLYRLEVPLYSEMSALARTMGVAQLATFHERRGLQGLFNDQRVFSAAWGRIWGQAQQVRTKGNVSPEFDGVVGGAQIGHDVYVRVVDGGARDHIGILGGWTHANGRVNGFALGFPRTFTGTLSYDNYSGGFYWTHIMPSGTYIDTVVLGTSMQYESKSQSGLNSRTRGRGISASLEGGISIPITSGLALEPQAQIIGQRQVINDFSDVVSSVAFNNVNSWLVRVGGRVEGKYDDVRQGYRPYLLLNVLHSFGNQARVLFGGETSIVSASRSNAAQFGAGFTALLGKSVNLYGSISYLAQLDGVRQRTVSGTLGGRWQW